MSISKLLKHNKFNGYIFVLFLVSLFLVIPVFIGYSNGDDAAFHLSNIIIRSDSLFDFPWKILPNVMNNLGYGTGIFYPSLPHMFGGALLFVLENIGINAIEVLGILKFAIILFSGLSMYFFAKKLFNDNSKGMTAAIFYITSSYFFVDLYVRDSLNESFIFIFMPVIFLGLYYLFEMDDYKKFYALFVVGYTMMMNCHLVMSVWFTLFLMIFILFNIKKVIMWKYLKHLILSSILILILTSTFWVPMVQQMFYGNNVIFKVPPIPSSFETISLEHFFFRENYKRFIVTFNFILLILFVITLYRIFKNKIDFSRKKYILTFLIILILSLFFVSCSFIWDYIPSMLLSIQFPWRLISFAVFSLAILACDGLDNVYHIFKSKYIILAKVGIIVILMFDCYQNMSLISYDTGTTNKIKNMSAEKTDDVLLEDNIWAAPGYSFEYLNREAMGFRDYLNSRDCNEIKVIEGKAKIKVIENDVPKMTFKASNVSKGTVLELPRIYYLGYKIKNSDGNIIDYSLNEQGLIIIPIDKNGVYEVTYPGTAAYNLALVIKGLTIDIICVIIIIWLVRRRKA